MREIFKNRTVAVIREITKIYESTIRGSFDLVIDHFKINLPRGEFVILLSPPKLTDSDRINDLLPLVDGLTGKVSIKELSIILSRYSGISKNTIYNFLLAHGEKND